MPYATRNPIELADYSPANVESSYKPPASSSAGPSMAERFAAQRAAKSAGQLAAPKKPALSMADDDESEVPINPVQPLSDEERQTYGPILQVLSQVKRNKQGDPENTGVAIEHSKEVELLKNARQPDRYVRSGPSTPRVIDPNAPPPPRIYEPVSAEHPGLVRKVRGENNLGGLYIQVLAHPGLPHEKHLFYHGDSEQPLTPEETEELQAHFLKEKTPGVEVTKPHLNSQGKITSAAEKYPVLPKHVSSGFYRVGYNREKVMEGVLRYIRADRVHNLGVYDSKNIGKGGKKGEPIQRVHLSRTPGSDISTSNKPHKGHKPMKDISRHYGKQLSDALDQELQNGTGMSNEGEGMSNDIALGGSRIRSWRSYAYRKLGLPKLGLADEGCSDELAMTGPSSKRTSGCVAMAGKDSSGNFVPGHTQSHLVEKESSHKPTEYEEVGGKWRQKLPPISRGENAESLEDTALSNESEPNVHEALKGKYTSHDMAKLALKYKDEDPKASRGFSQLAGDLAGAEGDEVGMAGTSGSGAPAEPETPAEPKAPTEPGAKAGGKTPGIGKSMKSGLGKVGGTLGRAAGQAAAGALVQGAAKKLGTFFSNDLNLSNTPSSHRITRSPGNQILFNLRQKKDK